MDKLTESYKLVDQYLDENVIAKKTTITPIPKNTKSARIKRFLKNLFKSRKRRESLTAVAGIRG